MVERLVQSWYANAGQTISKRCIVKNLVAITVSCIDSLVTASCVFVLYSSNFQVVYQDTENY